MSRKAPFISRKYPLGDWGNARTEDNIFFDEETNDWENEKEKSIALLSDMLSELLVWLSEGNLSSAKYRSCLFRKSIALIWCMRPDLFDNRSLREISSMGGVSVSVASLSKHVTSFTERFGRFHNGTKSDEAKEKYSDATRAYHSRGKKKQ